MKLRVLHWLSFAALLLSFSLSMTQSVLADDDDDPPSRVARLSLSRGEVSFSPAGTDDWVSAVVNRPLTTGDKLWTDRDGRAELHAGSVAFHLSSMTGFSFLNLNDRIIQVRLTEGTINFHVRRLGDDESIEIDTPNLAFSVLRPGHYRVNVDEAGDTTIINVRDGQGEVTGGGSAYTIHAGEQAFLSGTDYLNADVEPLAGEDDFDRWCNERDLREEHAASRRYVSDDVIGYEDLDDYGGWRTEPEYGTVWFPHVTVVNWAPYRYGHWAWISPWGWTWVDDAPWGFAPFHYGRWISVRGAWGWVPCPPPVVAVAYIRPVYAPALVAWVGGPHFGAGIVVGGGAGVNVGWFPLGPREVYVPSYHVSRRYVNNVNISNTTVNQTVINNYYNTTVVNKNVNVTNVRYVNQNVQGGVTATSGQNFTSARPVDRNLVRLDRREIASAPVTVGAPTVAPPKQAVMGSGTPTNYHPPARIQNRGVVAKSAPPPPPPSFAKQQAAIQANDGRPISMSQTRQLETDRTTTGAAPVKIAPVATPVAPRVNNVRGNRRENQSGQANANRPGNANPNPNAPQTNPNLQQANPNAPVNSGRATNSNPNANVPPVNPNTQVNTARPPSANPSTNVQQGNPNAPVSSGRPPSANGNQPPVSQNTQPNATQPKADAGQPANPRQMHDRPPSSKPSDNPSVDPQLEQKHQQQNQQLQQKQDRERQKLDEKRYQQEQQLEKKAADEKKQQQVEQKQQQQLQQMEQKHNQQQQQLQQKQQVEHTRAEHRQQPPPPPQPKPKSSDDKPHQ